MSSGAAAQASSQDLQASITAMGYEYPSLRFSRYGAGGRWVGRVQPIQSREGIAELLDDLAHDRAIHLQGDRVEHLPECDAAHREHPWMSGLSDLQRTFEIAILHPGDASVPRGYVLSPAIPRHKQLHMWGDGAMCPFLTSDDHWVARRNTVADIVPYFLVWLVKWMVYDETNVWIGREHKNDPASHLRRVGRNDQCWCGSGMKYKKCHLRKDELQSNRARR